ncbi:ADP-ribosyltransferase [uncultured Tolumonas sp.]|uniref:ADP-ribosyltransferase n=1 Tax=uncultured Tolumonas sp. TaxID=263765 RepID=UPI002A0A1CBB|nr:ADP-ribosyltransferase [uncultured Tolumonas sp.]
MRKILGSYTYEEHADRLGLDKYKTPSQIDNYKVALNYYTNDGYLEINSQLRSSDPDKKTIQISDYIDNALMWLPDYNKSQCVIRFSDLSKDIIDKIIEPNMIIHELGFTSSSNNPNFNFPTQRKYKIFIYKTNGSEISEYSEFKDESEVLIDRSSFFKVLRFDQEQNTLYLEQINPEVLESNT